MAKVIGERIYHNIGLINGKNKLFLVKNSCFYHKADFFVVIENINLWFYSKILNNYLNKKN